MSNVTECWPDTGSHPCFCFSFLPPTSRSGRRLLQTFATRHLHCDGVCARLRLLHQHRHSGTSWGHSGVFPLCVLMKHTWAQGSWIQQLIHGCKEGPNRLTGLCWLDLHSLHALPLFPGSCTFTWKRRQNKTRKGSTTAAGRTSRLPRPTWSSAPDETRTMI